VQPAPFEAVLAAELPVRWADEAETVYRTQVASDCIRKGFLVWLLDGDDVVAEVFRCDADKTVTVIVEKAVSLRELEGFLAEARRNLDPFEDGTPLANAR
jgi:hypothetical protein